MSLDLVVSGDTAPAAREQVGMQVLERVRATPGVRAASLSVLTPLSGRDTGKLSPSPDSSRAARRIASSISITSRRITSGRLAFSSAPAARSPLAMERQRRRSPC